MQETCYHCVIHVIAGASSGIGAETTRVLALRGVHVVMGIRNLAAGGEIKETIQRDNPSAKIDMMELDLSSMESVRKFAAQFKSCGLPLNILVYVTTLIWMEVLVFSVTLIVHQNAVCLKNARW